MRLPRLDRFRRSFRRRGAQATLAPVEALERRLPMAAFELPRDCAISENEPAGSPCMTFINPNREQVALTTTDEQGQPLQNDNDAFRINGNAVDRYGYGPTLLTTRPFDFEAKRSYTIHVRVTHADGSSQVLRGFVGVMDEADTRSSYVVNTLERGADGTNGLMSFDYAISKPDLAKTIRFSVSGTFSVADLLLGRFGPINGPVDMQAAVKPDGTPSVVIDGGLPTFAGAGNVFRGIAFTGAGASVRLVNGGGSRITGCRFQRQLVLEKSDGNQIGGTTPGDRNVFLGGIALDGSSNNVIEGNLVGIDPLNLRLPGAKGIVLDRSYVTTGVYRESRNNRIGGLTPGSGNVISGIRGHGISVLTGAPGTVIQGNLIGTDIGGKSSGAVLKIQGQPYSELGNTTGIYVSGSAGTLIGGTAAGAGNVIAGSETGIRIDATWDSETSKTTNTTIQGNLIGVDATGNNPLPNIDGIVIDGVSQTLVGGTVKGAGNVIANGSWWFAVGVTVTGAAARGNSILGNAIYGHTFNGITLGERGPTVNDSRGHDGPNAYQNFPTLIRNADGSVNGILKSDPLRKYRIELFAAKSVLETHTHPQGYRFLGAQDVTTDAKGVARFTFAGDAAAATFVATATSPEGNTSEFTEVGPTPTPLTVSITPATSRVAAGRSVAISVKATGIEGTTITLKAPPYTAFIQGSRRLSSLTFKANPNGQKPFDAVGRFQLAVLPAAKLPAGLGQIVLAATATTQEWGGAATTRTASVSLGVVGAPRA